MKVVINKNSWFMERGISEIPCSIDCLTMYHSETPFIFKHAAPSGKRDLPFIKVHSAFYSSWGICDMLNGRYYGPEWVHNSITYKVYRSRIIRSKPPKNPIASKCEYLDKPDRRVLVEELDPGIAFTLNERSLRGRIFMKINYVARGSEEVRILLGFFNAISIRDGILVYIPEDMLVETVGYELVTV